MTFTLVTRCNCGCDTSDIIEISAASAESAVELLRCQWEEEERDVEILALFEGTPKSLPLTSGQ
jgi:hypothetical protein